jgi:hypothetical protein
VKTSLEAAGNNFDAEALCARHPDLVARREAELAPRPPLPGPHPRLPAPAQDRQGSRAHPRRGDQGLDSLPEHHYLSIRQLVKKDRAPADSFSLLDGQRVSAIATDMYLSQSTVRNHLSSI